MGKRLDALVDRLIARAQRTPYFHLTGYMERWWLFGSRRTNDAALDRPWPITARIHHILRSDNDRHLHDHPWWNISIVLRGGYWEWTPKNPRDPAGPQVKTWRGPGSIVFRRASAVHRLELPAGTSTWSLFVMGPKSQAWGFYTPDGKVHWRDYESYIAAREGACP
jgi:hypothetical protein